MTERPILFSTEMVKEILAGRKTMTRRIIKGQPLLWLNNDFTTDFVSDPNNDLCPQGDIGDQLWVRETSISTYTTDANDNEMFLYRANDNDCEYYKLTPYKENPKIYRWKPSIFMPKRAARIWLEITDIKIERLNEISEEDAIKEGVAEQYHRNDLLTKRYKNYLSINGLCETARLSFMTLWSHINGTESWNTNPWVWVISFKALSTTGKPYNQLANSN